MDTMALFQRLMTFFCQHIGRATYQDRRRLEVLAWAVIGLVETQRVTLSEWGTVVQSRAHLASSHQRRFVRWLNNPHIAVQAFYQPLLQAALTAWPETQRLHLALDSSCLPHGLLLIRIALVYRGRTLPVSWQVVQQASATVAYEVYERLLQQVQGVLPRSWPIELTADRGFCNRRLVLFCFRQRWHFRLRVPRDTLIEDREKRLVLLRSLRPPRGAVAFYPYVYIFGLGLGPVHLAVANPAWTEREDPWYVVSDERTDLTTFEEYSQRVGIAEGFLDDKSGGFQVEASEIQSAAAWERLYLVLAVAMLHLTAIGAAVVIHGWRRWVDPHWDRGLSYFKVGWRWLRQQARKGWPLLFTFVLDPAPDPQPAIPSRRRAALPPPPWQFMLIPP